MRFTIILAALFTLLGAPGASAQTMDVAEPYKVGTFEIGGVPTVGLVLPRRSNCRNRRGERPRSRPTRHTHISRCRLICSS